VGREKAAGATGLIFIASTRFMLPFHFIVPKKYGRHPEAPR
jgi:hypothetical protein